MIEGETRDPIHVPGEQCSVLNESGLYLCLPHGCECRLDVGRYPGLGTDDSDTEQPRRCIQGSKRAISNGNRIEQVTDSSHGWNGLLQHLQSFAVQLGLRVRHASNVSTWVRQAVDACDFQQIRYGTDDNRDPCRRLHQCPKGEGRVRVKHVGLEKNQFSGCLGDPYRLPIAVADFESDVAALDPSQFGQRLLEVGDPANRGGRALSLQNGDERQLALLCLCDARPAEGGVPS
jgi:hypothetical protein